MEKELMLQKGFDVMKLEERCELVEAAAGKCGGCDFFELASDTKVATPEMLY